MIENKKLTGIIISAMMMLLLIIYIGPMDAFVHGFFSEEIDCTQIAENDWLNDVNLENSGYEMVFSPQKDHFVGFSIFLNNQPEGNTGNVIITILDELGKQLDMVTVDLSKVHAATWYKVYTEAELNKGDNYTLRFTADNCATVPYLQNISSDYLPDETVTGNLLISYAYAESTFTFTNKVIIGMFIVSAWLFVCGCFIDNSKRNYFRTTAGLLFMTSVLTWNYMYNSMDNQNESFSAFQADSETLVTGVIYAERNGEYFRDNDEKGFGLGRYYDLKGCLDSYNTAYISDDNWLEGYSKSEGAIIVNSNIYTKETAVVGNSILFKNGEQYQITNIEDDGLNLIIYLNSGKTLSSAKNGSLDEIRFYGADNHELAKSRITAYKSQYGLQGKIFRRMAGYMDEERTIENLNLICCIAAALVFVVIVMLILFKYNNIFAGCFFVTFWLSPWVVNFARNLYWVEFTWFIPMAIGLFCAWKIDSRKCRILSYVLTLISITVKCLCGYEYISVVMMGLIAFLLIDFMIAVSKKNKEKALLLCRSILIIGIIALTGFMIAICIHALLKGGGSILEGIKNIFEQDILRRTDGANLNDFDEKYWPSINASVWEVYCKYFHFSTEVITGIAGNLFPVLCVVPLCVFGYEFKNQKINLEFCAMYVVFFLTSISWFCLAKSHSYVHTHMNYVLWYFGFVQVCIYIIVHKVVSAIKKMN